MRLLLSLSACVLLLLPAAAGARTIDNTGIAGSEVVDGMWDQICLTLPFCDVGEQAVDMAARQVINIAFSLITATAVIVTMYGGIMMIVSRGNEDAYGKAKTIMTTAAIGLLIAVVAEQLVLYVALDLVPRMLGN